ncbi:hypothetical protein Aros01_08856 [Streptosporangium roseum]|uniref:hypothetical protein n=1 Tax=Streptosporangium roseum TaxID=2001 RepID=UPI0026D6FCE0
MQHLRVELGHLGITADLHHGHGAALLSVWVDLLVWSDGSRFLWWNGDYSSHTDRRKYAAHLADHPATAARRIAARYADLRKTRPMSSPVAESAP